MLDIAPRPPGRLECREQSGATTTCSGMRQAIIVLSVAVVIMLVISFFISAGVDVSAPPA